MNKKIPTQIENPTGLHQRYRITKLVKIRTGAIGKLLGKEWEIVEAPTDPEAEYFVLRLDEGGGDPQHILACRVAVLAYARAIEHHLPDLARDIKERWEIL